MTASAQFLRPSTAARRLGVSSKALRLYEQRGLLTPIRTSAGWRAYGPDQMARAAEIAAWRSIGLSLAQVAQVLAGDPRDLASALAAHQATLVGRMRDLSGTIERVRTLRTDLIQAPEPAIGPAVAFDLPWPWDGERFELGGIRRLTFIVGPLGSGKTRLAKRLAETLPGARFLGLDRSADGGLAAQARLDADPLLVARVGQALDRTAGDGAVPSDALVCLLAELESESRDALVVDMVEHGLDEATQRALILHLRRRADGAAPLFLMTRSRAILDLDAVGPEEAILFCPANHSAPVRVDPYPGAVGYEALASCLASPEVRARTEGVIAWRPGAER